MNRRVAVLEQIARDTATALADIRAELRQVKSHGEWEPWLEREFPGWTDRTARKFMTIANAFGKTEVTSGLQIDTEALYVLAGPHVPEIILGSNAGSAWRLGSF